MGGHQGQQGHQGHQGHQGQPGQPGQQGQQGGYSDSPGGEEEAVLDLFVAALHVLLDRPAPAPCVFPGSLDRKDSEFDEWHIVATTDEQERLAEEETTLLMLECTSRQSAQGGRWFLQRYFLLVHSHCGHYGHHGHNQTPPALYRGPCLFTLTLSLEPPHPCVLAHPSTKPSTHFSTHPRIHTSTHPTYHPPTHPSIHPTYNTLSSCPSLSR